MIPRHYFFSTLCFVLLAASHLYAAVITVNIDGTGDYDNIQAAVDAAVDGDIVEVGDGTYKGDGNKNIDFEGKLITLKSKNGPDYTEIDCENDGRAFYFRNKETSEAVVSGFSISRAYTQEGGAIRCGQYAPQGPYDPPGETEDTGSPTIENCIFVGNRSNYIGGSIAINSSAPIIRNNIFHQSAVTWYGGAIAAGHEAKPVITNCTFTENVTGDGGSGGAIYINDNSDVTISGCTFRKNRSDHDGGAITVRESKATIDKCIIQENNSYWGAGISAKIAASFTLTNSLISDNDGGRGGGIACRQATPTITNCTITRNFGSGGNNPFPGIGGFYISEATGTITNTIIWGNELGDYYNEDDDTPLTVQYSNIAGLADWESSIEGEGNIDADPLFVSTTNFHLTPESPSTDTGTSENAPPDDLENKSRPQGNGYNMGAYEEVQAAQTDKNKAGSASSSTCFINNLDPSLNTLLIFIFLSAFFIHRKYYRFIK